MATENGESSTRWEGYSHFEWVSHHIGQSVFEAIKAYSMIDSMHAENAAIPPQIAARARSRLMTAALQLVNEMENDREAEDFYDEALDRWQGEDGYISKLSQVSLQEECPAWLFQFMMDIRKAGWELGYLQAGRQGSAEPADSDSAQVREMIE